MPQDNFAPKIKRALAAMAACCLAAVPAAQAQESTWNSIKERGAVRLGVVTGATPWFDKNPQTGEWSGVGYQVGKAAAEALDVDLETVEVTWGGAVAALQSGKIDMMPLLDPTPSRAVAVDFVTYPLLFNPLGVLVRDDMDAGDWDDLNRPEVRLSVPQGTSMDEFLTNNTPNATLLRLPGNPETVAAFQSGRVDGAVLFLPPLMRFQQKLGSGKVVRPSPPRANPSSIAVRRETDKTWRDFLSSATLFWHESGKIQGWYEDYLRGAGTDPAKMPPIAPK